MSGKRVFGGRNGYDFAMPGSVSIGKDDGTSTVQLGGVALENKIVQNILLNVAVDTHVFIAPFPVELDSFEVIYAAAQGGAATLDLKKCTGTTAPASGTTMLASTVNLNSTINTTITATKSATVANTRLADGDKAALDYSTTIGSLAGAVATIVWKRIG